jgi:hypothetical protein
MEMTAMRVLRGRPLAETDRWGSEEVAVINQSLADEAFAGSDPIGRRIALTISEVEHWVTVVGVTLDQPNLGARESLGPEAYLCHEQFAPEWASYYLLVRTSGPAEAFLGNLRQAVRSVDPALPVSRATTIQREMERVSRMNLQPMQLIWTIAAFGVLMAILGTYGVVSRSVVERTREIGVRISLGARNADLLSLIIRQGMYPVLLGVLAGVILALGVSYPLQEIVYRISSRDVPTYLGVCAFVILTAVLAMLFPAVRATRVNPMVALKSE